MESQGPKLVGGCRGRLRTRPPCQPPAFRECADLKIQSLAKEASTLCNQLLGLGLEFPPQVSPDSGRLCILGIFLSLRVPSWGGQLGTETGEEVGITGQAQGHRRASGKVAGGLRGDCPLDAQLPLGLGEMHRLPLQLLGPQRGPALLCGLPRTLHPSLLLVLFSPQVGEARGRHPRCLHQPVFIGTQAPRKLVQRA